MLPVKPYTIAVPANGSVQMQLTGRYLRVNACSNPITVAIDGVGTLGAIGAGQGFKMPADAPPFARLLFTDASGAVNNVTFIVADADFVDNTVLGTVNVVDGGKSRVLSQQAFLGNVFSGNVAAQFSYGQLFNPAGSGKRAVVEALTAAMFTGGTPPASMNIGITATQLSGASANARSKLGGGAVAASLLYADASATNFAARFPNTSFWDQYIEAVNRPFTITPKEPIVLPPGYGLVWHMSAQNSAHVMNIEFYEEPNT